MSNIFALQGKGNLGKTWTINQVYLELQNKYSTAQATLFTPNTIDVKAIMDIPIRGNIIKVGIESQGDPDSRLNSSLVDFVNANCDIIICACRTSGETEPPHTSARRSMEVGTTSRRIGGSPHQRTPHALTGEIWAVATFQHGIHGR